MTPTPQEAALRAWVVSALPALNEVIFTRDDGPRPAMPYAAIRVTSDLPLGSTAYEKTTDTPSGDEYVHEVKQNYRGVARIDVFAEDALALLKALNTSRYIEPTKTVIRDSGLSILQTLSISDQTTVRDTSWERRAQADFRFRYRHEATGTVPVIETVDNPLTAETP